MLTNNSSVESAAVPGRTPSPGPATGSNAPGMRRVRLLVWALFCQTPMDIEIGEEEERQAARRCKLSWEEYCALKATHPGVWQRGAEKRERAKVSGWPAQPPGLRRARKVEAPRRAFQRKERPRWQEWAARRLMVQRGYKRTWHRHQVLDRLLLLSRVRRAERRADGQDGLR
jgi:hypothetical protein